MSTVSKGRALAEVHTRALRRIDGEQTKLRDERLQCLKDRRFYSVAGAQWEGPLGDQFENKPKFEMNKTHLAVIRIINEYRNNRIAVDFTAKDGSENDRLADTCDGLYRADEQDSGAQEAFDNAFEEGVGGGYGALRLRARYEDEDDDEDERQRIGIERINDADSCVFFDGDSKRQDKADAKWCVVITGMSPEAYMDEYDEHDLASLQKQISQTEFDWCTPDVVYVGEYYEVEQAEEVVITFRGIALEGSEPNELRLTEKDFEDDPDKLATLRATGFQEVGRKRIKTRKIHKYQINGMRVIADEGCIAGKCLPVVPYYGKYWVVDGIERCMGHVRLARDAQMLINMLMSWLAEMAARFDMEKPILTPEQISGHAQMWADDNVKKFPYLLINPMTDAGGNPMPAAPVGYTKAPMIPPAMAALMQIAEQSLQDLLGNQQAGEQVQSNISGKVIELVQNRLDMQVFIYMSNMAKMVKRAGEVWLSMAKEIYVEQGRKMKSITSDGETGTVELLRPVYDEKTDVTVLENDLAEAKFDVTVDVGPSSTSRRSSTVRALSGLLQTVQDPETRAVLESMIILNMEGEGLQDVRDYFRAKLVRMGVVKPTEKEKQQIAKEQEAAPPDANGEYLAAAAKKALEDAQLAQAKVGLTHAQTIETLAGIDSARQADAIALAQALTPDAAAGAQPEEAPSAPAAPEMQAP
ncbi:MAG: portal protein [Pseudomonadota bacterium]